jgi:hypothetical protein
VSTAVPEVGDSVELLVGGDVTVRADVRERHGYAVWLAVPPVLGAGRPVRQGGEAQGGADSTPAGGRATPPRP